MNEEKNYPANFADAPEGNVKVIGCVYAGPDFFAQRDPQLFMGAYAGPVLPNGVAMGIGMAPPTDSPKRKWCSSCGKDILAASKFCPECGAPQPETDV